MSVTICYEYITFVDIDNCWCLTTYTLQMIGNHPYSNERYDKYSALLKLIFKYRIVFRTARISIICKTT